MFVFRLVLLRPLRGLDPGAQMGLASAPPRSSLFGKKPINIHYDYRILSTFPTTIFFSRPALFLFSSKMSSDDEAKAGAEGALKASELLDALAAGISHPSLLSQLPFFVLLGSPSKKRGFSCQRGRFSWGKNGAEEERRLTLYSRSSCHYVSLYPIHSPLTEWGDGPVTLS